MDYTKLASNDVVKKTAENLQKHGINIYLAKTREDAKKKVFSILPENAEIMTMSSVTLDTLGIANEINQSNKYKTIRDKLMKMDRKTQGAEMQKLGAAPEWAIGSIHAVTEDGKVMIASNTGSQLPAYAYGAEHVIWIAGTHKIVKNIDDGFKRIYEHSLPLESERAKKAYGVPGSAVNKLLIINHENDKERIHLIFVPEALGF